ncbi:MAG: holo-ACP synthase [Clostridiales bacterium]|nr:holo-ACP synthase [Clostridiales bacterium]
MFKLGTDIVKISRIEKSIQNKSFLQKVFTLNEIEHCVKAENFAGIFAAKEAYFKASETGLKFPLTNLEVVYKKSGKPYFKGISNCDLSISHDGDYAVASVILWE